MTDTSPFTKFLRTYRKAEVIFAENTLGSEMYIIHSGKVKLTTTEPGHEVTLATLGPGEFFGEMALCDSEPRTATATADEDETQLIVVDHDKFFYLVSQRLAFALTIMHGLCTRIRERWSLYEKMHQECPPQEHAITSRAKKKGDISRAKEQPTKAIDLFRKCGADGWVTRTEKTLAALS